MNKKRLITDIIISVIAVSLLVLGVILGHKLTKDNLFIQIVELSIFSIFAIPYYITRKKKTVKVKLEVNKFNLFLTLALFLPIITNLIVKMGINSDYNIIHTFIFTLIVGIVEELLFRDILYDIWIKYSPVVYLLGINFIFGILHLQSGFISMIHAITVGFSLSLARIKGFPVWSLIIIHVLIDFVIYTNKTHSVIIFNHHIGVNFLYGNISVILTIIYIIDYLNNEYKKGNKKKKIATWDKYLSIVISVIFFTYIAMRSSVSVVNPEKQKKIEKKVQKQILDKECGIIKSCIE